MPGAFAVIGIFTWQEKMRYVKQLLQMICVGQKIFCIFVADNDY